MVTLCSSLIFHSSNLLLEIILRGEPLPATGNQTFERRLPGVLHHVNLQLRSASHLLAAGLAHNLLLHLLSGLWSLGQHASSEMSFT